MDTTQRHSGPRRLAALLALAAALAGCSRDMELPGAGTAEEREPASLVVTAELPRLSVAVRGTRADGEGGTGFDDIDKDEISRLTLFLIDWNGNRLVGYRNIYPNRPDGAIGYQDERDDQNGFVDDATGKVDRTLNKGTKVRLTFDHDDPKHGASEILTRGEYTILAVANFREASHAGYETEQKIDAVIREFNNSGGAGIPNFKDNETCKEMYNMLLKMPRDNDAGAISPDGTHQPYLRPSTAAIPVSCALDLPLVAGTNKASLKLTRVCARVQIKVKNYSTYPLTVHDLKLSDKFTQSACFLIPRRQTYRNYTEWTDINRWDEWGAPEVTNGRAITPFQKDMTIEGNSAGTIFDGLIYESCDSENDYTYTLDIEYENLEGYAYFDLAEGGPITKAANVRPGYYLIKRLSVDDFIYATDATPRVTTSSNLSAARLVSESQDEYFWELVRNGNGNSYLLRNVETDEYIQFPGNNNRSLTMVPRIQASAITFRDSGSGIALQSGNAYASVSGASLNRSSNSNNASARFVLVPLERHESARLEHTITLTTIDPVTAEVFPVHEIRRNDFIHILVEVAYNPDKGDFDFKVSSWYEVENDIEYN